MKVIVTCIENYRESLIGQKDYLVIEVYISKRMQKTSFRISDEQGTLTIFNYDMFVIKEPSLSGYSIKFRDSSTQITVSKLLELERESSNINGLWGEYFDGDVETTKKVHEIIEEFAKKQNVQITEPVSYSCFGPDAFLPLRPNSQ